MFPREAVAPRLSVSVVSRRALGGESWMLSVQSRNEEATVVVIINMSIEVVKKCLMFLDSGGYVADSSAVVKRNPQSNPPLVYCTSPPNLLDCTAMCLICVDFDVESRWSVSLQRPLCAASVRPVAMNRSPATSLVVP